MESPAGIEHYPQYIPQKKKGKERMKKNAKRLLGLLIALAMMVSLVGTMALADSSTVGPDDQVTYIGTSVSSGFFLPQNDNKWEENDWKIIKKEWTSEDFHGSLDDIHLAYRPYDALAPDSAPRIIAEKLRLIEENNITNRCDNFHKMCFTGLRTKEALRFLYGKNSLYDLSCRSDWLSEAYMNEGHYSGFTPADRDYFYDKAQTWIKKSDIVIVELGGNDVMTTVIDNLFDERGTLMRTVKVLNARALHDKLVDIVKKGGDLSSVVITALDAAQKAGELPLMMTAMTKALLEGTMMFYTNYGKVINRPYLGISVKYVADESYYGAKGGVYIAEVVEGGPAAKAGIEEGDRIISMGGVEIVATGDIIKVRDAYEVGDAIEIVVERDGRQITLTLVIGDSADF